MKASWSPSVALSRTFGNRVGNAARQRADAGVGEKNFVAHDGKFVAAQFFVRQDFFQGHEAKFW